MDEKKTFQPRWQNYCRRFGPIMEPAFKNDMPSRLKLLDALDFISARQLNKAVDCLQEIREQAVTDADTAAWSFFIGFCFELAGQREHMMHCYKASTSFEHSFYLPYLKMAVAEHSEADFSSAKDDYVMAMSCLGQMPAETMDSQALLRAWTGTVSCLTMMHRYSEAEEMMKQGDENHPRMAPAAAVLYAALGNRQKTQEFLEKIQELDAEQAKITGDLTAEILNGSHPHFHPQQIETKLLEEFWLRFSAEAENLKTLEEKELSESLSEKLSKIYPFMGRPVQLRVESSEKKTAIYLKDCYAIGLQQGFGRLLNMRPDGLGEEWSFAIEH